MKKKKDERLTEEEVMEMLENTDWKSYGERVRKKLQEINACHCNFCKESSEIDGFAIRKREEGGAETTACAMQECETSEHEYHARTIGK